MKFFFLLLFSHALIAAEVSVMTYNVQNLFDTVHQEGVEDWTYLPVKQKQTKEHFLNCGAIRNKSYRNECADLDWNEDILAIKLKNLAAAIKKSTPDGKGPDILGLQEVENKEILHRLNKDFLADSGYKTEVLLEGRDRRGINNALLSKLPLAAEPKWHDIIFRKNRKKGTERGILEVKLKLPTNDIVTVYVLHLLAPSNPTLRRTFAIEELNELQRSASPKDYLIAMGDFNITAREEKKFKLVQQQLVPTWIVSHLTGCSECNGTHYTESKKEWSFFDMILLSQNFADKKSGWQLNPKSIRVAEGFSEQIDSKGLPKAFDAASKSGVSDHLPLVLNIESRSLK